ncbi:MAG: phytase [Friedmanniella sp.]
MPLRKPKVVLSILALLAALVLVVVVVRALGSRSDGAAASAGPEPAAASHASAAAEPERVAPLLENTGFAGSGDLSDDSAIWVDPVTPANSVVIADDKASSGGGIGVFGMDGKLLQFRPDGRIGNVDVRDGFPATDGSIVLVGANNRSTDTLALWSLDTATRTLSPVTLGRIATAPSNYGFCMYHSTASGRFYGFVTPHDKGMIQQFELIPGERGTVDAKLVRSLPISSITESCVADDDEGVLYVGQEDVGIWKFGAEPDSKARPISVDTVGNGHLVADIEGMSIVEDPDGSGYLFVSSQGDSTIAIYQRGGTNEFVKKVKVVGKGGVDAVSSSDGLDVTSANAGPGFEQGVLVVHDGSNAGGATSNLKYVPLNRVVEPAR